MGYANWEKDTRHLIKRYRSFFGMVRVKFQSVIGSHELLCILVLSAIETEKMDRKLSFSPFAVKIGQMGEIDVWVYLYGYKRFCYFVFEISNGNAIEGKYQSISR